MTTKFLRSLALTFCCFSALLSSNLTPVLAETIDFAPRNSRIEKLKRELDLTDDQAKKIESILVSRRASCEKVTGPTDRWKCMHDSRNTTHGVIDSLLSEDQKDKFDEMTGEEKMTSKTPRPRGRQPSERKARGRQHTVSAMDE